MCESDYKALTSGNSWKTKGKNHYRQQHPSKTFAKPSSLETRDWEAQEELEQYRRMWITNQTGNGRLIHPTLSPLEGAPRTSRH
jgi:hypothetical protein